MAQDASDVKRIHGSAYEDTETFSLNFFSGFAASITEGVPVVSTKGDAGLRLIATIKTSSQRTPQTMTRRFQRGALHALAVYE
jgi:hypothetical protein